MMHEISLGWTCPSIKNVVCAEPEGKRKKKKKNIYRFGRKKKNVHGLSPLKNFVNLEFVCIGRSSIVILDLCSFSQY